MHPCHLAGHRDGFPFGTTVVVREGEANDCGVDFSIVRMRAGEVIDDTSPKEVAWVLLDGAARVETTDIDARVERHSLFDERPSVFHLPPQAKARIAAESDVEWACVRTSSTATFAPKLFLPADTSSEARGKGLAQDASLRVVRLTFDLEKRPESKLVIGEVVHLAGKWSSYPPHHHAQPELYHYRFTKPQGYGHAELGDDVLKVKQNDTVKILDGVDHPQVAAPGYGMYYLWIVRHREGDPYRGFTFTEEHAWILEGKDQGWAPKDLVTGPKTERVTLAAAIVRFLKVQRIKRDNVEDRLFHGVFGIFGHGNVAGLGQALEEHAGADLPFYVPKNEQGAVHAAVAFAKARKRLGVLACTTSVGPGATNMITGAATATVNRLPVLLLPGDTFANRWPNPVLQQLEHPSSMDISVNDCFRPVSRFWDRIQRPEQILASLPEAVRVLVDPAETGAVTLCLPEDVQAEAFDCPTSFFEGRVHTIDRAAPAPAALQRAVELLRGAKRPLVIAGGGVHYSDATAALRALCDATHIPVAVTQAGMGSLLADHASWLGGLGVTGTRAANAVAEAADVVIALGTRLSDFTTASKTQFQNPAVRFIGVNVNAMDAHKHGAHAVVADARLALEALTVALAGVRYDASPVEAARAAWSEERRGLVATGAALTQAEVIDVVNEAIGPAATVVHAAGGIPGDIHKLWCSKDAADYHSEYGYSCMGYEVAGALGVKLADPSREVYALLGDGSYLMLANELLTSIQEGLKITVILVDNHGYQCIHNLQRGTGGRSFGNELRARSGDVVPVDFAKNAESLGARAWTAKTRTELVAALAAAKESSVSGLIYVPLAEPSRLPGSSWWDVPVPEVSGVPGVVAARTDYVAAVKRRRFYY